MTIRISSKRENFRRCGMPHPKAPVEYPDDRFTEEDLEILKSEPMLTVEIIEDKGRKSSGNDEEIIEAAKKAAEAGEVTGSGKPKVEAIEAILGRSITASDRDSAWDKIQADQE
ncbi:MAG: hypothetical protein JW882_09860 [Deltaproteobacteria bacterium]|nr:hypothetical protein [Deltaproteobacteria bacterium]